MDLRIFTEPQQGASYEQLLAVAQATEAAGLDAFFRSDHFLVMGDPPNGGLPGSTDAWATLAALARETTRIRLGTLVTSATFRWPGHLAVLAAQVDAMSGGRVEVGIGAGWFAEEHRAYGFPFPESARERFDRLEEYLAVVTGLWATPPDERFSFEGTHFRLQDSPALPKPLQAPLPVIVGGHGTSRTPALAARFASECNVPFPDELGAADAVFGALERSLQAAGRPRDALRRSVALTCCVGESEAQCAARAKAIGRDLAELRRHGAAGLVDEAAERLQAYAKLGVSRVYLQLLDLSDLDHIALIGSRLAPIVADW